MMQRQGAVGPDGTPVAGGGAGRAPGNRRPAAGAPAEERTPLPERSIEYIREVRSELQRVAWPGRSEVANYTVVVFVTIVLLTALVYGLDVGIASGILHLFHKPK